ncbi:hypothetical protein PORY_000838 [Pneumocystis oryctolagi]|uniref:Uncharacterized protein n=1 Tax=Pneumocystis oryctolagi TaxID=42067 RepID=A0ACB7CFY8_9ASCO|nr:hypothetical protein PORY_000838 [Pneumocystis oryctolagi]
MLTERKWKQELLRKVKSTPFFRNHKREPIFSISMETIPSLTPRVSELSEISSDIPEDIAYESTEILQNEFFYSKLDISRDVYELNRKCVLYNCFPKKNTLNSNEMQEVKKCISEEYCCYKTKKILYEILETEKSYVRGLEELVEIYVKNPLPIMLYKDSQIVFANILPIFIFHKQYMLPGIINALESFNPVDSLAKEFLKNKDVLKIYSCYVSGFQDKIRIIMQWENSKEGKRYLKSRRILKSHSQLNLISYLLLPIQRIPRYKLLLFNLLECQDSLIVLSAFNQICFLACSMNERRHQEEGSRRLFQLQQDLCYSNINIIEPWRKFIKESKMHYLLTTRMSFFYDHLPLILDREVSVVLCSDILIILNYTCTSIIKTMNVKELQITHAWERPNIGLRFIFWELEEIWHFDAIEGNADEWVDTMNKMHTNL